MDEETDSRETEVLRLEAVTVNYRLLYRVFHGVLRIVTGNQAQAFDGNIHHKSVSETLSFMCSLHVIK